MENPTVPPETHGTALHDGSLHSKAERLNAHFDAPAQDQSVTVIIPGYNAAETICAQLEAVAAQLRCEDEIIVVDDCSADATSGVVTHWAELNPEVPLTLVRRRSRGGPNASRNAGARFANGELLAFTDGDDVVCPGWLDALRAACAPNTLVTGVCHWPGGEQAVPPVLVFGYPSIWGSCMAVRRSVVRTVGGFDENIIRGGTESEFALRAQFMFNMKVVVATDAAVNYQESSLPALQAKKTWSRAKGHSYIANKFRNQPDVDTTWLPTGWTAVTSMAKTLARIAVPRRHTSRSTYALRFIHLLSVSLWMTRYRFRRLGDQGAASDSSRHYQVNLRPRETAPPKWQK